MKLENQVTSLALSQRLKELGVKQDSFFKWREFDDIGLSGRDRGEWVIQQFDKPRSAYVIQSIAAFTVAELGEMLPSILEFDDTEPDQYLQSEKVNDKCWNVSYVNCHNIQINDAISMAENEADARAKMLIYLIENDLWNK